MEFLDFTSLTLEEFEILLPTFESAFQAHMAVWCLDGKPRTARRFSVYQTCPLAAPEDRLFFLLTYFEDLLSPGGPGTHVRDGPEQSQSVDPCPLPALLATLRDLGDAPARSLAAL